MAEDWSSHVRCVHGTNPPSMCTHCSRVERQQQMSGSSFQKIMCKTCDGYTRGDGSNWHKMGCPEYPGATKPASTPPVEREPICPRCSKKDCPAARDWHEPCETDDSPKRMRKAEELLVRSLAALEVSDLASNLRSEIKTFLGWKNGLPPGVITTMSGGSKTKT